MGIFFFQKWEIFQNVSIFGGEKTLVAIIREYKKTRVDHFIRWLQSALFQVIVHDRDICAKESSNLLLNGKFGGENSTVLMFRV